MKKKIFPVMFLLAASGFLLNPVQMADAKSHHRKASIKHKSHTAKTESASVENVEIPAPKVIISDTSDRVALVIGNKDYLKLRPLRSPLNDAQDMKEILTQLGFKVIYKENAANRSDMDAAVHEFKRQLTKNSIGVVYYSGHGAQADAVNYLIPVEAEITTKAELQSRAYDAGIILAEMREVGNPVNIVILDACRDTPYKGFKGGGEGLASMSGPTGSLIAFATEPGKQAIEILSDRNGLYTKYLKHYLTQPGLEVETMLKQVRLAVLNEYPEQTPWENSSLTKAFCFAGCANAAPVVPDNSTELAKIAAQKQDLAKREQALAMQQAELTKQKLDLNVAQNIPVKTEPTPQIERIPALVETRQSFEPEMVKIKGGCFQMGSPESEEDRYDNERQHRVCVENFEMGKYEVTQAQWQAVMGNNPSRFKGYNLPVESVSWKDVQSFIEKLNAKTGKVYRLPTEAEWEYAARAGTTTAYFWGDNDSSWCGFANASKGDLPIQSNSKFKTFLNNLRYFFKCQDDYSITSPIGVFTANEYGLFDMVGNVSEWTCSEYKGDYEGSEKQCAISNNDLFGRLVIRGGSWISNPNRLRSAFRNCNTPGIREHYLGFRLSRV